MGLACSRPDVFPGDVFLFAEAVCHFIELGSGVDALKHLDTINKKQKAERPQIMVPQRGPAPG